MPSGRQVIIAVGKAAQIMARAAVDFYLADIDRVSGLVISPEGAGGNGNTVPLTTWRCGHPLPTDASLRAGQAVLDSLTSLGIQDRVLCLLSGGASALMTVPDGVSLADLRALSEALLASGADIGQLNTVRRKLCLLKGGGLARAAEPAAVTALLVSDVVGDAPALIGSGPTVADPDDPDAALAILDSLDIEIPAVTERLGQLQADWRPAPVHSDTRVVASGTASLEAAAGYLEAAGYRTVVLTAAETGDSAATARRQAAVIRKKLTSATEPLALLSGGETTVRTTGARGGRGGRNSHFALALACELWGESRMTALSADTDGLDGNSGAAGAFVTPALYRAGNLEAARAALRDRDSGGYLAEQGHALVTGPTGTNVNDLRVILLEQA